MEIFFPPTFLWAARLFGNSFLVDWAKTKTYFAYFSFSLSKHNC